MPLFSPDGRFVLSSDLPAFQAPGFSALGWAWLTPTVAAGYGGWNTAAPGLYSYDAISGQLAWIADAEVADQRAFFAGGQGRWLSDHTSGALDSEGHHFPNRWAAAMSPEGIQVCIREPDFSALITRRGDGVETVYEIGAGIQPGTVSMRGDVILYSADGIWRGIGRTAPPLKGSNWRFQGDWITGYVNGFGLCLFRWDGNGFGYVISRDGRDYNPDLWVTDNSHIMIVSAQTAGETKVRSYAVDTATWPRVDLTKPPVAIEPIPSIGKPCWMGFFEFTPAAELPSNCRLTVPALVNGSRPPMFLQTASRYARYIAASSDSDIDELDRLIAAAKTSDPTTPVAAYWTRQAQLQRPPVGADIVLIEAYRGRTEPRDVFRDRLRLSSRLVGHPWLIPQCYSSNTSLTEDLLSVAIDCATAARDIPIEGLLLFSGPGRLSGWTDHPEVHAAWRTIFASIPGIPTLPVPTPAPPPTPAPTPPHIPGPPPAPEVPMQIAFSLNKLGFDPQPSFTEVVTVVPHPDGHSLSALQYADGTFASYSGAGWDQSKPSAGAWERYLVSDHLISTYRGGTVTVFPCVPVLVL